MQRTSHVRSAATRIVLICAIVLVVGGLVYYFGFHRRSHHNPALDVPARTDLPSLPEVAVKDGDWPWWRGPTGDHHAPNGEFPTTWSETKNVLWKQPIAGKGHASPILVDNRIILATADDQAQIQMLIALDRETGQEVWRTPVHKGGFMPKHSGNTHASATPAFDGKRIFVTFANNNKLWLSALNLAGEILWQREAGPHGGSGSHGAGPSPIICGSHVIVNDDSPDAGFIAAIHRQTGDIVWRTGRNPGIGSYGTPAVANWDQKRMILLGGGNALTAYDPDSGKVLWRCEGIANTCASTVTIAPSMAFTHSGYPNKILIAVRKDGSLAWKFDRGGLIPYPPSTLWHDGFLYVVSDSGMATCLDAESGKVRWTERLGGGTIWASPLLVGKNIFVPNQDGTTFVFEASPEGYIEVARNKVDGNINASLVAINGRIYLRTDRHLYCIGVR